jgi:hypothetical protein
MDIVTDTTLMGVPTLDSLSGHLLFLCPLLRQFDTTITDLILLRIIMSITGMIEFGFQDIGDIELAPTVGEEFGFLATGNGDRIDKDT